MTKPLLQVIGLPVIPMLVPLHSLAAFHENDKAVAASRVPACDV